MLPDRIASKIQWGGAGECWPWTGYVDVNGYGRVRWAGAVRYAHRVVYEVLTASSIPVGLELDHRCRVRHCVNPAHLEPVTGRENTLRGASPAAVHAAKERCHNGHLFSPENTYIKRRGGRTSRVCRACKRAGDRRRYHAPKETP